MGHFHRKPMAVQRCNAAKNTFLLHFQFWSHSRDDISLTNTKYTYVRMFKYILWFDKPSVFINMAVSTFMYTSDTFMTSLTIGISWRSIKLCNVWFWADCNALKIKNVLILHWNKTFRTTHIVHTKMKHFIFINVK